MLWYVYFSSDINCNKFEGKIVNLLSVDMYKGKMVRKTTRYVYLKRYASLPPPATKLKLFLGLKVKVTLILKGCHQLGMHASCEFSTYW